MRILRILRIGIQNRKTPSCWKRWPVRAKDSTSRPPKSKQVFDLVKDFGTSEPPKSTRSSTTHWCPGRPGHPAFRHNIASSLRLHTGLPYDWTPHSDAPLGSPLAPSARRVSRVASRLPGTYPPSLRSPWRAAVAVDPIGPHVHIAPPAQIPLAPLPIVRLPALLQAADRGGRQTLGSFAQ